MRKLRGFGHHYRARHTAFRALGLLIATGVFAALVAWGTTAAQPISQNPLAANQLFSVALPLVIRLEPGELLQGPLQPAIDATDTPTATPTNTPTDTPTASPTNTPTVTPTARPTNTPECDLAIKQNLQARLPAPNTATVTNNSSNCTYAVGLASYSMVDDNLSHQQLFSSQTALIGPGETLTLVVELPACAYQLDLFYGPLIERFDPQHGQIYGDRILLTRVVHGAGFCVPGTTTPTSISTPSATPDGSATITPTGSPTLTPTATESPTPTLGGT